GGILPCGKHFPGHGDTETDSHLELPVVRRSRTQLEEVEMVPFRAAIAAGIPSLMSSHVLFPGLDADRPATLSRRILTDLLRGELGFEGLISTDDLEMRAISDHQPIAAAAVDALAAGADLLLACQALDTAEAVAAAIDEAIQFGRLDAASLETSAERL